MINKIEFLEKFKEQFLSSNTLDINENTEFRQLDDWDSLTGMAIQVMIQDDYGVDLTVEKFKTLLTPGEVLEFIQQIH
jgi:acyl carrier protein